MYTNKKIAIIGLGYVGLPLAVEFGKNLNTIGFDINLARIAELQLGKDHTLECSSEELKSAQHLSFTGNTQDLRHANIFIVTVPTPVDQANRPDMMPLIKASETVGKVLKAGDIVVYESTVYPGATEEVCVPVLERFSGLSFNQDFFCGYSPERINPGDKVNTLTTIRKITSGSTPEVAEEVDALYKSIIKAGTWKASTIKVAEAAKVIENSQRDLNIAFVNELSVIFERLGIDTIEVLEAAGSKWNFLPFRPGMVGGHCIGVDPYYLTHKAEELGYHPQIILAGRRMNDDMARYAALNVIKRMLQNGIDVARSSVGVMGITFKENCPDIRNSKVADLVKELQSWGVKVVVTDPWANAAEVEHEYGIELGKVNEQNPVDSLVIAVGHKEYRALPPSTLKTYCTTGHQPVAADLKSLPEAAQLVIQAAAMATGGDVFVLDMGQPVKILDLAKRMVELSGLTVMDSGNPMGDIEIQVTGLRPGEKLYEELLIGDNPLPTSHPRIMKAHEEFLPWDELESELNILNSALESNNVPFIRTLLKELVPGYQPESEVVDWVWMENEKASA
jgi:UDP-N-acetyl-D-galactosamine dehydrogenase